MADYVVKLTGQDGLTPTLKNVKQELQSTGNVAKTELTKITERFEQIEKSSMPVKREIKAITDLMAKMNAISLLGQIRRSQFFLQMHLFLRPCALVEKKVWILIQLRICTLRAIISKC